jgi:CP family cyanate transporter-like MFS transporter
MNDKPEPWAALLLLWTCGASLRLTVLAVPPVLPIIQHDFQMTGTQIGLLSGMPVVLFAIAAIPGSSLIARVGVRRTLLAGLAIAACGGLARAWANSVWLLYSTTILMSAGIAAMQPAMAAAVRSWVPERSTFGTAVYTNGLLTGEIIPVAMMLPIVLPFFGKWQLALGAWSVPLIVTAILVLVLCPPQSTPLARIPIEWLPQLNSRLNWQLGLILGSIASTYFCVNGFMPSLLGGRHHPELISPALTALNFGQIPASLLLLFIADRLQGRLWPYLLCAPLMLVGVVGVYFASGGWTIVWSALLGATCGGSLVLGLALAPLLCRHPDEVARTSASAFAISYSFAMLISLAAGAVWDGTGKVEYVLLPIVLGILPLLSLAPTLGLRRNTELR